MPGDRALYYQRAHDYLPRRAITCRKKRDPFPLVPIDGLVSSRCCVCRSVSDLGGEPWPPFSSPNTKPRSASCRVSSFRTRDRERSRLLRRKKRWLSWTRRTTSSACSCTSSFEATSRPYWISAQAAVKKQPGLRFPHLMPHANGRKPPGTLCRELRVSSEAVHDRPAPGCSDYRVRHQATSCLDWDPSVAQPVARTVTPARDCRRARPSTPSTSTPCPWSARRRSYGARCRRQLA